MLGSPRNFAPSVAADCGWKEKKEKPGRESWPLIGRNASTHLFGRFLLVKAVKGQFRHGDKRVFFFLLFLFFCFSHSRLKLLCFIDSYTVSKSPQGIFNHSVGYNCPYSFHSPFNLYNTFK